MQWYSSRKDDKPLALTREATAIIAYIRKDELLPLNNFDLGLTAYFVSRMLVHNFVVQLSKRKGWGGWGLVSVCVEGGGGGGPNCFV